MRGVVDSGVAEPAGAKLADLAADLDSRPAAVDEVELVLRVVVVQEAVVAGRHHDRVHAEGCHAEGAPHLAEAVPLAQLVDRGERVSAHSRLTMSSASWRVKARSGSVCSAPCRWSFMRISIAISSSGASKISTTS